MEAIILGSQFDEQKQSVVLRDAQDPIIINQSGGTYDHSRLSNRNLDDQHSISSITGLQEALDAVETTVVWGSITGDIEDQIDVYSIITSKIDTTLIGVANGVASLDSSGTVPLSQIPSSILGGLNIIGVWNASTNTPTLTSGVGTKGDLYIVNVAGSTNLDGIVYWKPGDSAFFDGAAWQRINGQSVTINSVFGRLGTVIAQTGDYNADQITETATRLFISPAEKNTYNSKESGLGTPSADGYVLSSNTSNIRSWINPNEKLVNTNMYSRSTLGTNTAGDIRIYYTSNGRYTERYNGSTWDILEQLTW